MIFHFSASLIWSKDEVSVTESNLFVSALTIGHEALLVDLLVPGSSAQSLRETSSPIALSRLSDCTIQCPDDIYEVLRKGRITRTMGLSSCSCTESRLAGSLGSGSVHTMLTLQLENKGPCKAGGKKGTSYISRVTFVELAPPDTRDICDYGSDSRDTRSLATAFSALTGVLLGLGRPSSPLQRCTDTR